MQGHREQRLLDPPAPGPGYYLAHLDPVEVVTFDDAHNRMDNSDVVLAGESEETAAIRTGTYADAESVYQVFQDVQSEAGQSMLYSLTVYAFASEESASTWLDNAPDLIEANPYYGRLQEVSGLGLPVNWPPNRAAYHRSQQARRPTS